MDSVTAGADAEVAMHGARGRPGFVSLQRCRAFYGLDPQGRLTQPAFAQTPQSGRTGYSSSYPAASRCRAAYQYDAQGHLLTLSHVWDVLGTSGYTNTPILANQCTYDATLGLKTFSSFYTQGVLQRTETYGYDQYLDYPTSASYNDGVWNANPTWSYDAAGNRTFAFNPNGARYEFSTFDNLNRPGDLQGVASTNDIAGNRLTLGSNTYGRDPLSRMTSYNSCAYAYRAGGMRISKTVSGVTTRYRYDGQMGIEDTDTNGNVKQYGIGARGIESITNPSAGVMYPIYDGHGNMTATICRSGSNSFTVANTRSYDAWGLVRFGSGAGDPTGRYCANLGHKQDDESGLIYMRARYYEPASGRFISEDPGTEGLNWFAYANNDPVEYGDRTGRGPDDIIWGLLAAIAAGVGAAMGNECAKFWWTNYQEIYHGMHGVELAEKMQETLMLKSCEAGISGGLSFLASLGLVLPWVVGSVGKAGMVGLAFAVGFFIGFITTFYSMELLAVIGDIDDSAQGGGGSGG